MTVLDVGVRALFATAAFLLTATLAFALLGG